MLAQADAGSPATMVQQGVVPLSAEKQIENILTWILLFSLNALLRYISEVLHTIGKPTRFV
jgi:hypothetical protein